MRVSLRHAGPADKLPLRDNLEQVPGTPGAFWAGARAPWGWAAGRSSAVAGSPRTRPVPTWGAEVGPGRQQQGPGSWKRTERKVRSLQGVRSGENAAMATEQTMGRETEGGSGSSSLAVPFPGHQLEFSP